MLVPERRELRGELVGTLLGDEMSAPLQRMPAQSCGIVGSALDVGGPRLQDRGAGRQSMIAPECEGRCRDESARLLIAFIVTEVLVRCAVVLEPGAHSTGLCDGDDVVADHG